MNKLIRILLFCFIVLISCRNENSKDGNNHRNEKITTNDYYLPANLTYFIKLSLPNLKIPTKDLYVKGYESIKSDSAHPFICSSDFNGDGNIEYCIILMNDRKELFLYSFIAKGKDFAPILIDKFVYKAKGIEAVLSIENKGVWESAVDKITAPNNGITVNFIEESLTWSYYWKDDKFERFLYD
jgi:hypothetical protein